MATKKKLPEALVESKIHLAKIGEMKPDFSGATNVRQSSGVAALVADFERDGIRWDAPLLVIGPARKDAPATIRLPGTVVRGNRRTLAGQEYSKQIAGAMAMAPNDDVRAALEERYRADLAALAAVPVQYCYPVTESELLDLVVDQSSRPLHKWEAFEAALRALRLGWSERRVIASHGALLAQVTGNLTAYMSAQDRAPTESDFSAEKSAWNKLHSTYTLCKRAAECGTEVCEQFAYTLGKSCPEGREKWAWLTRQILESVLYPAARDGGADGLAVAIAKYIDPPADDAPADDPTPAPAKAPKRATVGDQAKIAKSQLQQRALQWASGDVDALAPELDALAAFAEALDKLFTGDSPSALAWKDRDASRFFASVENAEAIAFQLENGGHVDDV